MPDTKISLPPPTTRNPTVLLVDGDPSVLSTLRRLRAQAHQIEQVYTPAKARQVLLEGLGTHCEQKVVTALLNTLAAIEAAAIADVEVADLLPRRGCRSTCCRRKAPSCCPRASSSTAR